jgi:hypothetical protein
MSDAVGEHPRLAAARAGEDEQGPVGCFDGTALRLVETAEDLRCAGGGGQGGDGAAPGAPRDGMPLTGTAL